MKQWLIYGMLVGLGSSGLRVQASGESAIEIQEDLWVQLADEPGHHIDDGFASFRMGQLNESAGSIRKAAVFLQIAACNSTDQTKESIGDAAEQLEDVAVC